MINVMLVDDEVEIRRGLQLKVDWHKLGFHIIAEAANGVEALDKLDQLMSDSNGQAVDILITDMNMPMMDGVGLLAAIQRQYPDIKAIVLTGYDDFAYTKAAIRHRAVEYLLKPVMSDELEQVLLQLKQSIHEQRKEFMIQQESSRMHQRWFREIRENFAFHMLKGDLSSMIMSKASSIQIHDWDSSHVQVITIGLQAAQELSKQDSKMEKTEQFLLPMELMTREFSEQYRDQLLICKDSSFPHLIHMICRDGMDSRASIIEHYQQQVQQYLHVKVVLGISPEVQGFAQWHRAYMDALLQWSYHFSSGRNGQEASYEGRISRVDDDMLRKLLSKDELAPALQYISSVLSEASLRSQTDLVRSIFEVLLTLERLLLEQKQGDQLSHSLWLNPEQVLKLTTVDKAVTYIEQILSQNHLRQSEASNEDIFTEVLNYIKQNYAYEITLPSLAERFNYNTSYFSELFKAKVGQSFVQYLQEIRMNHACRLLETTELGLSDIAELTGFSNASYFSSRFKKIFNISPSEYRSEKAT